MDDVVTRLREWRRGVRGQAITPTDAIMEEAADEIERLREETDIVERLREDWLSWTDDNSVLLEEAAEEIERLRKANKRLDRYCLQYGKAYARLEAKLERAEAVIEAARHYAQDQYAMALAEKISTYDKERDGE
jgi:predicted RNase H-like nuclease (RuvC/YqgF family)